MNERRKVKMMKRSRKSERTLNSCMHGDDHGMEMRQTLEHLEPKCDVQADECGNTEQRLRRLQHLRVRSQCSCCASC